MSVERADRQTEGSVRFRWPFSLQTTGMAVVLFVALGLGAAGLGLALANRADVTRPRATFARRVEIVMPAHREPTKRVETPRAERLLPDLLPRIRDHLREGLAGRDLDSLFGWFGRLICGVVVEVDGDSVLIETADGERWQVQGTEEARDTFEAKRESGERVTVRVRQDADGSLTMVGLLGLPSILIAIGEVTAVDESSISVSTILGNQVEIALRDPAQAKDIEPGDIVFVTAERVDDALQARSVARINSHFSLDASHGVRLFPRLRGGGSV